MQMFLLKSILDMNSVSEVLVVYGKPDSGLDIKVSRTMKTLHLIHHFLPPAMLESDR